MADTPKSMKRVSLSLGRHRKNDVTTRSRDHDKNTNKNLDGNTVYNENSLSKSPSIVSVNRDVCTPPHKNVNMDDSIEYSPTYCDNASSPSCLLSQTLTSNSPEVGWKWGRRSVDGQIDAASPVTSDSAYVDADGSFTSSYNSIELQKKSSVRTRCHAQNQRFAYEKQKEQKEEKRRKLEIEMRRAEKLRADELLKQRCAKLEEQLREAEKRRNQETKESDNMPMLDQQSYQKLDSSRVTEPKVTKESYTTLESAADLEVIKDIFAAANDTSDDFFNDSDADGLLLEATQQVELKIEELSQKPPSKEMCPSTDKKKEPSSECLKIIRTPATRSSYSERQEKRSSLYMKFFEDDCPDDLFLSLDDVVLQATQQAKKPRNSFQRYHSMPTSTVRTSDNDRTALAMTAMSTKTVSPASSGIALNIVNTASAVLSPKIKRHSSSHAFNTTQKSALSTYHDRQPN